MFQPETQFKIIHDDQSLPPGLHVRLNLETGLKEAKINVPDANDQDQGSMAVVVEDPTADAFNSNSNRQSSDTLPVLSSLPKVDVAESNLFTSTKASFLSTPQSDEPAILAHLETLQDLCHSYDWGLVLAEDRPLLIKILNMIENGAPLEVRGAAVSLLATALQNNNPALELLFSQFAPGDDPLSHPTDIINHLLRTEQDRDFLAKLVFLFASICSNVDRHEDFCVPGLDLLREVKPRNLQGAAEPQDRLTRRVENFIEFYTHARKEAHPAPEDATPFQSMEQALTDPPSFLIQAMNDTLVDAPS